MPGYGAHPSRTHRIDLKPYDGSDNWVDIHESRSSAAATRVAAHAVKITSVQRDGRVGIEERDPEENWLGGMRRTLFEVSIVAWSLRADEGDPDTMPLTPATFDALDADIAGWLDLQITTYYVSRRLTTEALGESNGRLPVP